MEIIIASKNIWRESKLISGASFVSSRWHQDMISTVFCWKEIDELSFYWHLFICLTSHSHRTRMISIIKWHLTIKHPKGIPSEPHILPFKFATDASILYILEGYWAKNSSWMEVIARDMPSWRVKIKVERVCGLREGGALRFITSTFCHIKNEP